MVASQTVLYCESCGIFVRARQGAGRCAQCGERFVRRDRQKRPEDVFDDPLPGERQRRIPRGRVSRGSVGGGFFLGMGLHALQFMVQNGAGLIFVGITQAVYLIPAIVVALVVSKSDTARGLALAMGVTFMLNAACFGLLCGGLG